jgi:hypothetical protein
MLVFNHRLFHMGVVLVRAIMGAVLLGFPKPPVSPIFHIAMFTGSIK